MPRRVLREESPFGSISFDEYQAITSAILRDYKSREVTPESALSVPLSVADTLLNRRITITPESLWGRALELESPLVAPVCAKVVKDKKGARVTFSALGYTLVKGVERNGKGTGLLSHTASALSFREALLAELIVRFGKPTANREYVLATVSVRSLKWWLGITDKYPDVKNIRASIINKTASPLCILETADSGGGVNLELMCQKPSERARPALLVKRSDENALGLAKKSGKPLAAAIAFIEDARVLRPDLDDASACALAME